MKLKQLKIVNLHKELGANFVEYANHYMPMHYGSVREEHLNIRNNVGVFDVSHMGEFFFEGDNASDLLQFITTNDVSRLKPDQAQYSCITNQSGTIIDDVIVYCISKKKYMMVVNAANIKKDWEWIEKHNKSFDVNMQNKSDDICLFAVQGPNAIKVINPLFDNKAKDIKYYNFSICQFAGVENVIVSATGYTGSGGFEIYCKADDAKSIWQNIFSIGNNLSIKPAGLAARDTLRLEMGYCLYGNDIDTSRTPIEAGLGWITKFTKNFVGSDALKKQKEKGVNNKLFAFELKDKFIPRKGYKIFNNQNKEIGIVTSGGMSISLNKPIGMGYLQTNELSDSKEIFISIRDKLISANIVKLPFYKGV